MKKFLHSLLVVCGAIGGTGIPPASAELEISGSIAIHARADFYAPLTPQGTWIEAGSYGRCWRPAHVAVDWRPYCEGHWVWTDCGWYWASDEPWAWACYHYGTWIIDPAFGGWIWVPGIEWAPAWVTWRVGGGYCGWAPLAPRGVVVAPAMFVFVEEHRLREPIRARTVIVNNTTIINRTTVINNLRSETRTVAGEGPRHVMVNEGPGIQRIAQASREKIATLPVREAVRQTPVPPQLARSSGVDNQHDARAPKEQRPATDPTPNAPGAPGSPKTPGPGQERGVHPPSPPPRPHPEEPGPPPNLPPDKGEANPPPKAPPPHANPRQRRPPPHRGHVPERGPEESPGEGKEKR